MFNFENATLINKVNPRANYDLRYSAKTGKFNMSKSFFDRHDIQNNGFNILRDGNAVALQLVPNDEAALHAGRKGAENKGLSFTCKAMENILNLKEDVIFEVEKELHDGKTFFILSHESSTEETETETLDSITQ